MVKRKIIILGNEEIVILMGLLGIEGIPMEDDREFLKVFESLIKNDTIGMIIISLELSKENSRYLIDFKTNKRTPFIIFLPDLFREDPENNLLFKELFKTIKKITSQG